jgi:hypothetical protein
MQNNNLIRRIATINLALLCLAMSGCSALKTLDRRPFADKVGFIALQKGPYSKAVSAGEFKHDVCKKIWFGWDFLFKDEPTYDEVRAELVQEKNFKYLTNVTSYSYGSTGLFWGNKCIGLEGEAFR